MKGKRVVYNWSTYDHHGGFAVDDARRRALLTIQEVLGEVPPIKTPSTGKTRAVVPRPVPTPVAVPAPRSRRRRRRRVERRIARRSRRRPLLVAVTLALAVYIGAILGSGLLNSHDRYNAELVAAQQGALEIYELPEVQGHPGAEPVRDRSGSIREFLGMASAF